jgi:hypothetical protein
MVEGVSTAISMNDFKFLKVLIINRDHAAAVDLYVWDASSLTVKIFIT